MAVPRFMARINRRFFNPGQVRRGERPVLVHEGRTSGRTYETPLDAHPIDGGFVFFALYGPETDWVRNILQAGRATVRIDGEETPLIHPRLAEKDEVAPLLEAGTALPPAFLGTPIFLRMDRG